MTPIFVVKYQNPDVERRCIAAVREFADPEIYPLAVVDNYPANEPLAVVWNRMVRTWNWFQNPDPAFVLLNTDAFLSDEYTLPILEKALWSDPRHGFAGPMTDNAGSNQKITAKYWKGAVGVEDLGQPCGKFSGCVIRDQFISGFCLMVRRAAWEQCGGFPEDGPFYGQESALIWKGMTVGWRTVMCLDAYVEHLGGATCQKFRDQDAERQEGGKWFADYRQREYRNKGGIRE